MEIFKVAAAGATIAAGAAITATGAALGVVLFPVSVPVFVIIGVAGGAAVAGSIATGVGITGTVYVISRVFQSAPERQNPNISKLNSQFQPGDQHPSPVGPDIGADLDTAVNIDTSDSLKQDRAFKLGVSQEHYEKIKATPGFQDNGIHIAVAGAPGTGKSSLINALRSLRDKDPHAAPIGVTECTREMTGYPDERFRWIGWFDCPGGGTTATPGAGYFENQGLFIMDCIILLWGERFSELDVAIINGAQKLEIPVLIVRSKSDSHLRNMALAVCDDPENEDSIKHSLQQARSKYIQASHQSISDNLERAGLQISQDDCFLVNTRKIRSLMTMENANKGSVLPGVGMLTQMVPSVQRFTQMVPGAGMLTQMVPSVQRLTQMVPGAGILTQMGDNVRARFELPNEARGIILSPETIDEQRLLTRIFTSIAQRRYSTTAQ